MRRSREGGRAPLERSTMRGETEEAGKGRSIIIIIVTDTLRHHLQKETAEEENIISVDK